MPNLNLIDDEGGDETMQPTATAPRRGGGGGGGVSTIILIVVLLVVLGGAAFLLNKFGIVKLWGPKAPVVTQIQPDPFPAEPFEQDTAEDTSGIEFLETPPIDTTPVAVPEKQPGTVSFGAQPGTALAGMKGDYTIQVSAWRDQATADKFSRRLEEAGYPAYVDRRQYKNGTWYTVRIGRYQSLKDARQAVQSFAYELRANYWIDKVKM
ncbi:MAG: SPOR domain-containing protein [Bacteroidota bacterium]